MVTPEGATLLLALAAGQSQDTIAAVAVSDGDREAVVPAQISPAAGGELQVTGLFGADEANFNWNRTEIRSGEGVVIDADDVDLGRKGAGSVWTMEAVLEIPTSANG